MAASSQAAAMSLQQPTPATSPASLSSSRSGSSSSSMSSLDLKPLSPVEARDVLLSELSSVGLTYAAMKAIFRSHTMTRGGKQGAQALNSTQLELMLAAANSKKLISHAVYRCRRVRTLSCQSNQTKLMAGKAVLSPFPLLTDPATLGSFVTSEMKIGILQREQCKALRHPCTARNLGAQLEIATCKFHEKRAALDEKRAAINLANEVRLAGMGVPGCRSDPSQPEASASAVPAGTSALSAQLGLDYSSVLLPKNANAGQTALSLPETLGETLEKQRQSASLTEQVDLTLPVPAPASVQAAASAQAASQVSAAAGQVPSQWNGKTKNSKAKPRSKEQSSSSSDTDSSSDSDDSGQATKPLMRKGSKKKSEHVTMSLKRGEHTLEERAVQKKKKGSATAEAAIPISKPAAAAGSAVLAHVEGADGKVLPRNLAAELEQIEKDKMLRKIARAQKQSREEEEFEEKRAAFELEKRNASFEFEKQNFMTEQLHRTQEHTRQTDAQAATLRAETAKLRAETDALGSVTSSSVSGSSEQAPSPIPAPVKKKKVKNKPPSSVASEDFSTLSLPGSPVLPCNHTWEELTPQQKKGALLAGYFPAGSGVHFDWGLCRGRAERGESTMTRMFECDSLDLCTPSQRKGAGWLSITPSTFECLSGNGIIAYNDRRWSHLGATERDFARTLGVELLGKNNVDTRQWNNLDGKGQAPAWRQFLAFRIKFKKLSALQKSAVLGLHWTPESWNTLRNNVMKNVLEADQKAQAARLEDKRKRTELDEVGSSGEESDIELDDEASAEPDPEAVENDTESGSEYQDDSTVSWEKKAKAAKKKRKVAGVQGAAGGKAEIAPPSFSAKSSLEEGELQEEEEMPKIPKKGKSKPSQKLVRVSSASEHSEKADRKSKQGFFDAVAFRSGVGITMSSVLKCQISEELRTPSVMASVGGDFAMNAVFLRHSNHTDFLPGRIPVKLLYSKDQPWSLKLWIPVARSYIQAINPRHAFTGAYGGLSSAFMAAGQGASSAAAEDACFTSSEQLQLAIWTRMMCMIKTPITDCFGYVDKSEWGLFFEYNYWLMTLCSEYRLTAILLVDDSLMALRKIEHWDFGDVSTARETLRTFGANLRLPQAHLRCLFCGASGKLTHCSVPSFVQR